MIVSLFLKVGCLVMLQMWEKCDAVYEPWTQMSSVCVVYFPYNQPPAVFIVFPSRLVFIPLFLCVRVKYYCDDGLRTMWIILLFNSYTLLYVITTLFFRGKFHFCFLSSNEQKIIKTCNPFCCFFRSFIVFYAIMICLK